MITPTVGRVVLFHPEQPEGDPLRTLPGLVCAINEDQTINIAFFNEAGNHDCAQNVLLIQDDDPAPVSGCYAEWMPYQKGQAAKAEALESQLQQKTGA